MRLTFDPALDGPAWPGPLGDRDAVAGEAWVGPLGLLGVLETQLGLAARQGGALARACRLARALRGTEGYWRRSFERDPLGTSRRLLQERDILAMWGWRGQPVSGRLAELHRVTAGADPGLPDRLLRVVHTLGERSADISSLRVFSPRATLAPLWQAVLSALESAKVAVEHRSLEAVTAAGDLGRAREAGFTPEGDDSLCLLRRHGPLDTADEVAATLAGFDELTGVVVVNGDAVLDRALAQKGLPRLGCGVVATASSGLVSLVVEAAFEPMEPEDLHALLTMDPGPVPRSLAAELIGALRVHPGRRSPTFKENFAKGLESQPPERRADAATRVEMLLMPAVGHGAALPVETLRQRLQLLRGWAQARLFRAPSLQLVCLEIDALQEAMDLLGEPALTRVALRRLCSDLGKSTWMPPPAEAGLGHVVSPGAVLGPARTVIWWNFTRDQAAQPGRLFLTRAEESGLIAAGVTPPNFALLMEGEAQRWRRPLTQASRALVLVCPRSGESGEPNLTHPLWDELTASAHRPDDVALLEVDSLQKIAAARSTSVSLRPLAREIPSVTVRPLQLRELESPSSIERLLGCSLSWALHYKGRLRAGLSDGPALPTPLLMGSLAHDLLAQVFAQNLRDGDAAAMRAAELFEREAPRFCEALGLPRYQVQRATLKRAVVDSARELTKVIVAASATIVGTEMRHDTTVMEQRLEGHLDLVLASPDFVIDLKWGRKSNKERLENGTAVQLAAYAAMRGPKCDQAAADVGIGYFILRTQELLTEPESTLPGGHAPGRHSGKVMWKATLDELRSRQAELAQGLLLAPGTAGDKVPSRFDGTRLQLGPSCGYCAFGTLCGRQEVR
jgi:hypothetical protein